MPQLQIAKNLSRVMQQKGKTVADLSFDCRLAYTHIDGIIKGRTQNPSIRTLYNIASALEVKVDDLISPQPTENAIS